MGSHLSLFPAHALYPHRHISGTSPIGTCPQFVTKMATIIDHKHFSFSLILPRVTGSRVSYGWIPRTGTKCTGVLTSSLSPWCLSPHLHPQLLCKASEQMSSGMDHQIFIHHGACEYRSAFLLILLTCSPMKVGLMTHVGQEAYTCSCKQWI